MINTVDTHPSENFKLDSIVSHIGDSGPHNNGILISNIIKRLAQTCQLSFIGANGVLNQKFSGYQTSYNYSQ